MKNSLLLKTVFCSVFYALNFIGYSQEAEIECDLNVLENEYNIGSFEEVDKKLRSCLETFKADEVKYKDALRLIAMNSIMMDSMEKAAEDVNALLDFNSDYAFRSNDPYIFKELVKKFRNFGGITVTSVSKFEETLDEAPASIYVLTSEDIENRGYLDIEQVFRDLPGFSLSKSSGPGYVLVYPRGYRSTLNDKFLLLIDGVEENDLNSDNAVINRQIALANIKQIEIIYGPASTMYGANAFSAVINIITKDASFDGDNKFSADIQTNYGTWNTKFVDAMINRKLKNGYFSITGRLFHSDEMDLTDEGYNYNPNTYDYLSESTPLSGDVAQTFMDTNVTSPYFDYTTATPTVTPTVTLNQVGADKMKALDKILYDENPDLGFNNREDDWYVNTKLKIDGFTFGVESFRSNTGALPWYTKSKRIGSPDLTRWVTWNSSVYLKYEKKINQNLYFSNLTSYRLHTLDGDTNLTTALAFNNNKLGFQNLISETPASLSSLYLYRSSNQLRNELKIFYKRNNFNIVSGLEFRQGIFQMNYITSGEVDPDESLDSGATVGIDGGNTSSKLDVGYYAQGKYSFSENFSATLGGRVDYNLVRSTGGYGFVFNPRAALVYSKEDSYTFKAIYSEAFKDASFLTKYSTTDTRIANPSLEPEKVKNFEVSAIFKLVKGLSIEVNGFMSKYSNVVSTVEIEGGLTQNQGSAEGNNIRGLQAYLNYEYNAFSFWTNYTYLDPRDESVDLRISDIPSHSINAGFNVLAFKKLNFNLRANYVGVRKTGIETAGSANPLDEIDAFMALHANVNYELFKGFKIGVLVNNLLDETYYHPGVRTAANNNLNSVSLQNSRGIMFRANYKF
tara:strand:+ start:293 stop:2842 length:2550 start_codon:yes stop_codon:yes gene_type:complete